MLSDIIKIIFSFLLTGVVGVYIAGKIQNRNILNQIKLAKAEKEIEKTKEIIRRIETLSSVRIYTGRILVELLAKKSSKKDLNKAREEYRRAISVWNENLNSTYMELYSLNFSEYSLRLEKDVHDNFRKAHSLINDVLHNNKEIIFSEIIDAFSIVYKNTRLLSCDIVESANKRWDEIVNNNTVLLNETNIENASTATLIMALFHKRPYTLRIRCSIPD